MKKLKLNFEVLRVQSFDTGGGMAAHGGWSECPVCCSTGTVKALADTDDCASKKADTMCEPPPSGQQACFAGSYNSCQATQPLGHCC